MKKAKKITLGTVCKCGRRFGAHGFQPPHQYISEDGPLPSCNGFVAAIRASKGKK